MQAVSNPADLQTSPDIPELPEPRPGEAWTELDRLAWAQLVQHEVILGEFLAGGDKDKRPLVSAALIQAAIALKGDQFGILIIERVTLQGQLRIAGAKLRSVSLESCEIRGNILISRVDIANNLALRNLSFTEDKDGKCGSVFLDRVTSDFLSLENVSASLESTHCTVAYDCRVGLTADLGQKTVARMQGGQIGTLHLVPAGNLDVNLFDVLIGRFSPWQSGLGNLVMTGCTIRESLAFTEPVSNFRSRDTTFLSGLEVKAEARDEAGSDVVIDGGTVSGDLKVTGGKFRTLGLRRLRMAHSMTLAADAADLLTVTDVSCLNLSIGRRKEEGAAAGTDVKPLVISDFYLSDLTVQQFLDVSNVAIEGHAGVANVAVGIMAEFSQFALGSRIDIQNCSGGIWQFKLANWRKGRFDPQLFFVNCAVRELHLPRTCISIVLTGSTYANLALTPGDPRWSNTRRALKELLGRGPADPKIYLQLADSLRSQGYPDHANDMLYAERRRAVTKARMDGKLFRRAWLWLLDWTIGFGIGLRTFWVLRSVAILTLIGMSVLYFWPRSQAPHDLLWCLGASLHKLLPFSLSGRYTAFFDFKTNQALTYWQSAYFVLHTALGWVLASFLVTGISGLARKS